MNAQCTLNLLRKTYIIFALLVLQILKSHKNVSGKIDIYHNTT